MNESNATPDKTGTLEADLIKIRLEHKLSVRRMVLDRILLGLLVGLAAFVADLIVEKFKANISESRFFLEQRHAAATAFRKKLALVSNKSLQQTEFACQLDPGRKVSRVPLKQAVADAGDYLNSASLLFGKAYLDRMERVLNIFGGAAAEKTIIKCEHRFFFIELTNYATHITREEVMSEGATSWSGFTPEPVTIAALEKMGSIEYHDLNFRKWLTPLKPGARGSADKGSGP